MRGKNMNRVLNVGSMNLDYVYQVDHFVQAKETMTSQKMNIFPGGKGLNQSVALARAGCEVYHFGKIGQNGEMLYEVLKNAGIKMDYVEKDGTYTGNAVIQVTPEGQNAIMLYPGANYELDISRISKHLEQFDEGDVLLVQNEVNGVENLIQAASEKGMRVAFNPSPITPELFTYPLHLVHWLFLNEVEGEAFTRETEPDQMLKVLQEKFPDATVVLTLGSKGAYCLKNDSKIFAPCFKVPVADTTGAGDTFTGFYLSAVLQGKTIKEALQFATAAAALAVSSQGASSSIPTADAVDIFLQNIRGMDI
jgi:ribokinase